MDKVNYKTTPNERHIMNISKIEDMLVAFENANGIVTEANGFNSVAPICVIQTCTNIT